MMNDRMAALSRMAGKDPAMQMKGFAEGDSGGPEPLADRVDALSDNPEFTKELETLLAKYEGGGEEKPMASAPPAGADQASSSY